LEVRLKYIAERQLYKFSYSMWSTVQI